MRCARSPYSTPCHSTACSLRLVVRLRKFLRRCTTWRTACRRVRRGRQVHGHVRGAGDRGRLSVRALLAVRARRAPECREKGGCRNCWTTGPYGGFPTLGALLFVDDLRAPPAVRRRLAEHSAALAENNERRECKARPKQGTFVADPRICAVTAGNYSTVHVRVHTTCTKSTRSMTSSTAARRIMKVGWKHARKSIHGNDVASPLAHRGSTTHRTASSIRS